VREVEDGIVSRKLRRLNMGNTLEVGGPYGFFMTNAQPPETKNYFLLPVEQVLHLFIAL
jgi:ferredoxin-NADP reductase